MAEYIIEQETERKALIEGLSKAKLPLSVQVQQGRHRTSAQNRLMNKWYREIATQWYETPEYVRGYCKLHFGIPLLREGNEIFKEKYDAVLKNKTYEDKLALMQFPFELPVTSLMSVKQHKEYLDRMSQFFIEKGFELTEPDDD